MVLKRLVDNILQNYNFKQYSKKIIFKIQKLSTGFKSLVKLYTIQWVSILTKFQCHNYAAAGNALIASRHFHLEQKVEN